jgi:hypothetical protein
MGLGLHAVGATSSQTFYEATCWAVRLPTTLSLLAYVSEALSLGDELSCRTAATSAYIAVECTLMQNGYDAGKIQPIEVLSRRMERSPRRNEIIYKFR